MSSNGRQISYPEYEDFLAQFHQVGGAYKFVSAQKDFPIGGKVGCPPRARSLAEIEKSVLESPRVKNVIKEESIRRKCSTKEVRAEAEEILKEMAHRYSLLNVRVFGFGVSKAIENLFDNIYVNDEMMQKIRERSKKDPVVFMPSHKTYLDFLLLSLICFQYDIQLPAIAAGMDFMSMKFMGEILRRSGAFFMRRSFGDDQLYWAVFSEYVQTHVVNNDRTLEFFVEATRSRVGKSLHPKYGMLQMVLEPYLRGTVYDLVIVPVSMNYDKILEEKLYAYELLGFPKPKESTSGLLKAREILTKRNGRCFLTFGEPISVREYFGTTLHRNTFVCQPDSQFVLDTQAKNTIKKFAHDIVERHNTNAVITVWNLVSIVMLQVLDIDDHASFNYHVLRSQVEELIQLLNKLGTTVNVMKSVDVDLRYYLNIHDDLFEKFDVNAENFDLKLIDFPVAQERGGVPKSVMERAVSRLILTTYSNGMIHAVDSEGIVCTALLNCSISNKDHLFAEFRFLQSLMKREFVSTPGETEKLFETTLHNLVGAGIIQTSGDRVTVTDSANASLLSRFIMPYFLHFESVFASFDTSRPLIENLNAHIPIVQKKISDTYENRSSFVRLSFLSTEPIKNAFSACVDFGALVKTKSGAHNVNFEKLEELRRRLSKFTLTNVVSKL